MKSINQLVTSGPQVDTNRLVVLLFHHTGFSIQSVFGHREIVTCIAFCGEHGVWSVPGSGLLATGSHDATVLVWRWCGKQRRVVGSLGGVGRSKWGLV